MPMVTLETDNQNKVSTSVYKCLHKTMKITNKDFGFDDGPKLELLIFTEKELFEMALRYAERNTIKHLICPTDQPNHHDNGLLMMQKDALIFKPEYDKFKDLTTDLLE